MNLRASSGEYEAKNRCSVGINYKQRFLTIHGYLVSLNSRHKVRM
jgi:hypothetical protein